MTAFGRRILGDLPRASQLEWLVTNGLGGFAGSTLIGLNTRRYHGVLVAARRPPVERIVLVSRLTETLLIDGAEYPLYTARPGGGAHPLGHLFLERFQATPVPTWTWQIGDVLLIKTLFMIHGQNTTVVTYKVLNGGHEIELRLRPHLLFRDFHGTTYRNAGFVDDTAVTDNAFRLQPFANAPTLYAAWDRGSFVRDGRWETANFLSEEAARGLEAHEDDYSNGYLRLQNLHGSATIVFSDEPIPAFNPVELRKREDQRQEAILEAFPTEDPLVRRLLLAADQFIVERHSTGCRTIIAGYPWFSDWGRDSLISLPGLTLVPGRFDDARSILRTFALAVRDGLVPNCFADQGSNAMYNSVDASLWFFHAVHRFLEYTEDYEFVRTHLLEAMRTIVESFMAGTRYEIGMDPNDGLIRAGNELVQLTWMDAKIDEFVVTPRHGKAVEVNALWYNALRFLAHLLDCYGMPTHDLVALARKVRASFRRRFWNPETGSLHDVIAEDGTPDRSLRPNQIFAVFLPFRILEQDEERSVVDTVYRHLYTSHGLRSLAPFEHAYCPRFGGDRLARDKAYHQGTVWGYLIGPFITAFLKAHNTSMEAQLRASHMIEPFRLHLEQEGCIGSISEVFDANPPHAAAGCFAQAWSVAELLRCYVEDIKGHRPTLGVEN
ncbi:MAG TPA: amylo-alpha-1,6-glucosidase [Candidatus Ozemobacteraceae bacterium]|nr:amylo-alpha-1,6-glucosidase [Candidatus Ozemobacteraceae bacterium]